MNWGKKSFLGIKIHRARYNISALHLIVIIYHIIPALVSLTRFPCLAREMAGTRDARPGSQERKNIKIVVGKRRLGRDQISIPTRSEVEIAQRCGPFDHS